MNNNATKMMSIIICTLNRPNFLSDTVQSLLLKQSYENFEIIIIDQSDVQCADLFQIAGHGGKVKYFHIKEKGLPNARNIGIMKSKGNVLLFLDDDIEPDKNLLQYHLLGFNIKNIGCVAGRVVEKNSFKNTSLAGGKAALSGRYLMNFESPDRQIVHSACGANMSFSREAVEKTGFFDVRYLGAALLEESDYCYRLRAAGYQVLYEPAACLTHHKANSGGCRQDKPFKLMYDRFHNTALFYCKNMRKIFLPYVFAIHVLIGIKKILIPTMDIKVFLWVLKGFFKGISSYLNPPSSVYIREEHILK